MQLFVGRSRERSYPGAARFYREKGKLDTGVSG
jgi:hypothetical protein